jgi:tetratricopeptide (TPR) repeat protein
MKKTLILAFAITIITTFSGKYVNAQTKEDAGNAFNAALELSKTDMAGAVVKMQDVLKMCTTLGKDADSLKMKVAIVLPVFQYNAGNDLKNEKKIDLAIIAYEKSIAFADTYSDDNIKKMAETQLVALFVNKGITLQKADNSDSAIMYLDKALKLDPEQNKALFYRGLAYKKKGDNVKMLENMDLAIASGTKTNDTLIVKASKKVIGQSFYMEGKNANAKKIYSEAISKFNDAIKYDFITKDVYYYLAKSYNPLKKYDEAIEAANAGLALEEQTDEKLARFYFEIANAYEGKKDISNACSNYKKSAFGAFAKYSNDKIKLVLKCQ